MKLFTKLTLAQKIILVPTLCLLVGVGIFSALGFKAVDQATESMLKGQLMTAQLVADYLDEGLGRAFNELRDTASAIQVRENATPVAQLKLLEDMYSRLSIQVEGVYLLNERGGIIWSDPADISLKGKDLSSYPVIARAITKGEAAISGLLPAPVTDRPAVLLVAPTASGNAPRGLVVVAIDVGESSIGGFIQPIRLGETGYVEVVDDAGIVLARTDPGPKLSPFEQSDHSGRFAALIAAGEPTRGLCHTCHEQSRKFERRDVLAFVPLKQARWGVVVRQSEDEALAPIGELRRNLFLFGGGLVLVCLLFVAMLTRDVGSRIGILIRASRRISAGDLKSPINITQKDEIGVLASTLEEMRAKLNASYSELERRTEELSSLISVSEILSHLRDLSHLDMALGNALDKVLEIMNENTGGILLLDGDNHKFDFGVRRGSYGGAEPAQALEQHLLATISGGSKVVRLEDTSEAAAIPLYFKDTPMGLLFVLRHGPARFSQADMKLLENIAREIAVAIENARLHQEVQRKEQVRGELLEDLFSIQEEEQKRIARELHDETAQVVSSLTANLEAAIGMLPADNGNVGTLLRKTQGLSINILDEIHRLIYELRPSLLDDLGLVAAVRWLVDNNLKEKEVAVDVKITGRKRRLEPRIETALFRVIQEAVNNIARHAGARNASVHIGFKKGLLSVRIADDGKGFDVQEAMNSKERPRGLGLLGLKERIELLHGKVDIRSDPVKGGTEINMEIPL